MPTRTVHLDGEALADVVEEVLARGAFVRMVARGGSMSPWIRDGDVLTIVPPGAGWAPRPGDVVAFRRPGEARLVVHRLVSRAGGGWIARGDRCRAPDGLVARDDVLGTVAQVACGARRRLLPQGLLGLLLSSASRFVLGMRDRVRPVASPGPSGPSGSRA